MCRLQYLVSYPDPYVRNDDHRLQYDITYRGSGNKVVRNGSSATECCCTNQIAAIGDVDIPMLWPSANYISSMPIVKPHPKSGVIEMSTLLIYRSLMHQKGLATPLFGQTSIRL